MYNITILQITQIPSLSLQYVVFAIQQDAGPIYRYSTNIGAGLDVIAELQAQAADLLRLAIEDNAPTMTQGQVNAEHYAWLHLENEDAVLLASYTLEIGIYGLTIPVSVTEYRAVLNATLLEMMPLSGTQLDTHFQHEVSAQGLPALSPGVGAYTLAQCAAMDSLMRSWFSAFKVNVLLAKKT